MKWSTSGSPGLEAARPVDVARSVGAARGDAAGVVAEMSQHRLPVPAVHPAEPDQRRRAGHGAGPEPGEGAGVLGGLDDAALAKAWRVVDGDREVMAMPVGAVLRAIMLNHWYHHRGQLCVYLRQVGVPVPSVYGPSADENPFAAAVGVSPER